MKEIFEIKLYIFVKNKLNFFFKLLKKLNKNRINVYLNKYNILILSLNQIN